MRVIEIKNRIALKKVSGVYMISYGEKFYVGYSKGISQRLYNHGREVTSLLNSSDPIIDYHYLFKVVNHLKTTPSIQFGVATMLQYCTEEDFIKNEQKWLTFYKDNSNCLNMGFISKPGSGDVRKMNLKKV